MYTRAHVSQMVFEKLVECNDAEVEVCWDLLYKGSIRGASKTRASGIAIGRSEIWKHGEFLGKKSNTRIYFQIEKIGHIFAKTEKTVRMLNAEVNFKKTLQSFMFIKK